QRIAMRSPANATGSTGLTMLYGDHLGSASVAVDSGGAVQRMRYKAWGEARGTSAGAFATDRLFTGQVYDGGTSAGGTGLYYYNARIYDPALGRFTQADTIVPEPSRPLAFDRYAYTYNNPVRYTDPSGHEACAEADTWCWNNQWYNARGWFWSAATGSWSRIGKPLFHTKELLTDYLEEAGISFTNLGIYWTFDEMKTVAEGIHWTAKAVGGMQKLKNLLGGGASFHIYNEMPPWLSGCGGATTIACAVGSTIFIFRDVWYSGRVDEKFRIQTVTHELAHVMDYASWGGLHRGYYQADPEVWHRSYSSGNMQENWADGFTKWVYESTWTSVGAYLPNSGPLTVSQYNYISQYVWGVPVPKNPPR
ncbi:MAG: RHS repeat-associated core domain-containing protein, partial [Anaerolineales bacterium]|nr:RHS repeat-associated core domain-containing protein [Anaerolineales bacterium]